MKHGRIKSGKVIGEGWELQEDKVKILSPPGSAYVGALTSKLSSRLADLTLHQLDLEFCLRVLPKLAVAHNINDEDMFDAVFVSLITKFIGCFVHAKSRRRLDPKVIYGGNSDLKRDFDFYETLRNKHVVHDENSHWSCVVYSVFGPNYEIIDVISNAQMVVIRPNDHEGTLRVLLEQALHYTKEQFNTCKVGIIGELYAMSLDERRKLDPPVMVIPRKTTVGIARKR